MITPSDSPGAAGPYAAVPVSGTDIMAPQDDLSALCASAEAEVAPRQAATERLLASPQGAGAFTIASGASGGGGEDWPSDVRP